MKAARVRKSQLKLDPALPAELAVPTEAARQPGRRTPCHAADKILFRFVSAWAVMSHPRLHPDGRPAIALTIAVRDSPEIQLAL
ncbi:hypothetical protein LBMAG46_06200 [Planctomycetia bacterium]|nr:hypothetical protein LBMAG46_06200 [Planctomycetia bacterium]